jgi:hypothetical protein
VILPVTLNVNNGFMIKRYGVEKGLDCFHFLDC